MKNLVKAIAFVAVLFTTQAFAQVGQFYDTARVVSVQPIMQQAPQQDCYPQQQMQQNERSNGGGVIGGIAGALLGSQVGGGNGRIAAAALGGVVGALTGDRIDNRGNQPQTGYSNVSCTTRYSNQLQPVGYIVTFEYNGRQGQKRMPYDPGQSVRVVVSVDPQ